MNQHYKDLVIARLMHLNGSYWIFNKNYIDDGLD